MHAAIYPEDMLFDDIARAAQAAGMYLISNGHKVVVSPIVPPGFVKIAVKIKVRSPQRATLEAMPCAA